MVAGWYTHSPGTGGSGYWISCQAVTDPLAANVTSSRACHPTPLCSPHFVRRPAFVRCRPAASQLPTSAPLLPLRGTGNVNGPTLHGPSRHQATYSSQQRDSGYLFGLENRSVRHCTLRVLDAWFGRVVWMCGPDAALGVRLLGAARGALPLPLIVLRAELCAGALCIRTGSPRASPAGRTAPVRVVRRRVCVVRRGCASYGRAWPCGTTRARVVRHELDGGRSASRWLACGCVSSGRPVPV